MKTKQVSRWLVDWGTLWFDVCNLMHEMHLRMIVQAVYIKEIQDKLVYIHSLHDCFIVTNIIITLNEWNHPKGIPRTVVAVY